MTVGDVKRYWKGRLANAAEAGDSEEIEYCEARLASVVGDDNAPVNEGGADCDEEDEDEEEDSEEEGS